MPQETIGIMGARASFHDIAARKIHGEDADIEHLHTPREVLANLRDRKIAGGVLAIANNKVGYVQDLIHRLASPEGANYQMYAETYVPVQHCLMAIPGTKLGEIQTVHSHPSALGQCEYFLDETLPDVVRIEERDTATAAHKVADTRDPSQAAIASDEAARLYGLDILKSHIQDDPRNITRFVGLNSSDSPAFEVPEDADKTTVILRTTQQPGSLHDALGPFKDEVINISNIQSRIIEGSRFDMDFWLEFERGIHDVATQQLLEDLGAIGCKVTVLGSYKKAKIPQNGVPVEFNAKGATRL